MVSGCEISAENSFHINKYSDKLKMNINSLESNKERVFAAFTIDELNPHFFSWLGVLDTNIIIILVLIICVSGATVASGLLIIIIERIEMIGILKSIGATNSFVRKIFMNFSIMIIIRGLLIGNLIAFIVCLIQKHTHIIKLDSSYYYLNSVPIEFNWTYILMMNILVLILTTLITLSTSYLVSMDKPVKSMAFKL
jgi:lipoprotein-releasing system permease protein